MLLLYFHYCNWMWANGLYRWLASSYTTRIISCSFISIRFGDYAHALLTFRPICAYSFAILTLPMIICRKWCSYISFEMDWCHQKGRASSAQQMYMSKSNSNISCIISIRSFIKMWYYFPKSQHKDSLSSSYWEFISCCLHQDAHWFWGAFCCIIAYS